MRDMQRTSVLFTLLFCFSIATLSQALRGREVLSDDYLDESTYERLYQSTNLNPILNSKETSTPWIVWADRDRAPIYSTVNGVTPLERVSFLEEFKVLEVDRAGWFRVGRQDVSGLKSVGWMRANDLILHQTALRNQYAGAQKCMILTPLSAARTAERLSDVTFTQFLQRPERGSATEGEARRFSIFFVLKKEVNERGNEFALLASSSFIRQSTAKNEILGWIPAKALTEWNSRVGLDFAAGSNASKAYGNAPIIVADNEADAQRFHRNESVSIPMQTGTISSAPRMKITSSPLPDIELTNERLRIHEVVAIIQNGESGAVDPAVNEEVSMYLESLQTINLFFVIDGTMSMQPYIGVVKALASNIAQFNQGRDYHIRMGFAVYRDFPDGAGKLLEVSEVNSDMEYFEERISQIQCYSSDRDKPEAFYYGISEGLDRSGMLPTQTNLVILLGDVGNHRSTTYQGTNYDYNRALAQLKAFDASLFVFQVAAGSDWSYMDFGIDATRFSRDLGDGKRDMVKRKDGFELELAKDDPFQPYAQVYLGDKSGGSVSTSALQSSLEALLSEYIDLRETLTDEVGGAFGVNGHRPDANWVKKLCEDMIAEGLSSAACDLLNSQEVAERGFVSVQTRDRDVRCFTPYIFFTQSEIEQMNRFMSELGRPITGAKAGEQFRKVFLNMAKAFSGDDDASRFEDWTVKRLWEEFFQLPCGLSFSKTKIKDLPTYLDAVCGAGSSDPLCLEIAEMQSAAKKFGDRYGEWQWKPNPAIKEKFYWIPLDYFPGADADY